jgi:hypothetical protein
VSLASCVRATQRDSRWSLMLALADKTSRPLLILEGVMAMIRVMNEDVKHPGHTRA